jgi:NAD(P)H-dependent FMN reductase
MAKRRGQGNSRARAIQNVLARLGMQASPAQVVAALADIGIVVNEVLVRQVRVEMLKQAAKVERQLVGRPQIERPQVRRPPKLPPRRSFHS